MELWKDIKGYEGLYQVSNFGNVLTLRRNKILRPRGRSRKRVYLAVALYDATGTRQYHSIHRLVAAAFIPNPANLPVINHKDSNPQNNNVDNLEWCTMVYNNRYSEEYRVERLREVIARTGCWKKGMSKAQAIAKRDKVWKKGLAKAHELQTWRKCLDVSHTMQTWKLANKARQIPVVQYDLDGNKIKEYESAKIAAKEIGGDAHCIGDCCKGKQKTSNGFIWKYL